MTDGEVLSRIDDHIAVANGHMARGNELMARIIELHDDLRVFTRELLRRHELAMREVSRELRGLQAESRANEKILLDVHEESQAQRGATLALIDELREHGLGGRA